MMPLRRADEQSREPIWMKGRLRSSNRELPPKRKKTLHGRVMIVRVMLNPKTNTLLNFQLPSVPPKLSC
jgi:hypothetical protein